MPRKEDPPTPWRRASTSKRARRSETQAAKLSGGRRVPMSGAGRQKGDVRTDGYLIEDKVTDNASYSLKVDDLKKIRREASQTPPGLQPQFRLSFTQHGEIWRMLPEDDYLYLEAQAANVTDTD